MAGPVETISFVARRLIQFELKFAKAELPRRRGASQLFTQISRSVGAMVADLNRDNLPHDPCRELLLYGTRLAETICEELGAQEAGRLAEALTTACEKEAVYLEFRTSDHKKHLSEELEKASILIQALANGIYMAASQEGGSGEPPGQPRAAQA